MRIIAGTARGRKLLCPKGSRTRPTADRVREAVFSILAHRVADAGVLDLFSGTGAMGLEALSRGAREAVFVERDSAALRCLHRNVEACGFRESSVIIPSTVAHYLGRADLGACFDLVFADPPYGGQEGSLTLLALSKHAKSLLRSLIVVEHAPGSFPDPVPSCLEVRETRRYGNTSVTFLSFRENREV